MTKTADSTHLRIDTRIHRELIDYSRVSGIPAKTLGALAIARYLQEQGIDIQYPPKAQPPAAA